MTEQDKIELRRIEERKYIERAKELRRNVTFVSECDGCEVTVTASGNIFYNMSDWY